MPRGQRGTDSANQGDATSASGGSSRPRGGMGHTVYRPELPTGFSANTPAWPAFPAVEFEVQPQRKYGGLQPQSIYGRSNLELLMETCELSLLGMHHLKPSNAHRIDHGDENPVFYDTVKRDLFDWREQYIFKMAEEVSHNFQSERSSAVDGYADGTSKNKVLGAFHIIRAEAAICLAANWTSFVNLYFLRGMSDLGDRIARRLRSTLSVSRLLDELAEFSALYVDQHWLDVGVKLGQPIWDGLPDHPMYFRFFRPRYNSIRVGGKDVYQAAFEDEAVPDSNPWQQTAHVEANGVKADLLPVDPTTGGPGSSLRALLKVNRALLDFLIMQDASDWAGSGNAFSMHEGGQNFNKTQLQIVYNEWIKMMPWLGITSATGLSAVPSLMVDGHEYHEALFCGAIAWKEDDTTDQKRYYPYLTSQEASVHVRRSSKFDATSQLLGRNIELYLKMGDDNVDSKHDGNYGLGFLAPSRPSHTEDGFVRRLRQFRASDLSNGGQLIENHSDLDDGAKRVVWARSVLGKHQHAERAFDKATSSTAFDPDTGAFPDFPAAVDFRVPAEDLIRARGRDLLETFGFPKIL